MKVQVTIQGRTFTVKSDESGLDLPALGRYVDSRFGEVRARAPGGLDDYTVAILTCLNLASDLERYRRKVDAELSALDQELASTDLILRSVLPEGERDDPAEPSDDPDP